jgi:hypothetical protein
MTDHVLCWFSFPEHYYICHLNKTLLYMYVYRCIKMIDKCEKIHLVLKYYSHPISLSNLIQMKVTVSLILISGVQIVHMN